LLLGFKIQKSALEEEMVSQKTLLIAALVTTLAVSLAVMSISVVLGLLTTSKTVPSSGTINHIARVFRNGLPTRM
jgi:hypothetical protein